MKSTKLITSVTIGIVTALILIPKTRKMLYSAACSLTDSLKSIADNAIDTAEKRSQEFNRMSDKVQNVVSSL